MLPEPGFIRTTAAVWLCRVHVCVCFELNSQEFNRQGCVCGIDSPALAARTHTHSASQLRGWQREQHACGTLSLSLSVWQSSLWRSSLSSSLTACVSCRNPTERKSLVSFDAFVSAVHVWETLQTSLFPRSSFFCCLKVCLDLCLVYSSRCLRWLGQVLIGGLVLWETMGGDSYPWLSASRIQRNDVIGWRFVFTGALFWCDVSMCLQDWLNTHLRI